MGQCLTINGTGQDLVDLKEDFYYSTYRIEY